MPTSDVLGLSLWTFVGVMQLMFGITWLAAARLSDPLRQALRNMAWFNLLVGASLLLMGQRDDGSASAFFLTSTLPNLLQVVGFVMLWRAGCGLTGAPSAATEQRWLLLLACGLLLLMGLSPDTDHERETVAFLVKVWLLVRAGMQVVQQLRLGGQTQLATALLVTTGLAVLAFALRLLAGVLLGPGVDTRFHGHTLLGGALVMPIFAINMLAAYQAFGRVVQDVNRLARADALTGLADETALGAALQHAWRRFCQWQRPVALLELSLDQLDALREADGPGTAEAVLAELSWKLKLSLRAGDVLAHCGHGVFRVLLPDTPAAAAQLLARQLVEAVAADAGLHPEFGQRITLSAGLAMARNDDRNAHALGLRARAQRLCAQHAGGDQLVADAVALATGRAPAWPLATH